MTNPNWDKKQFTGTLMPLEDGKRFSPLNCAVLCCAESISKAHVNHTGRFSITRPLWCLPEVKSVSLCWKETRRNTRKVFRETEKSQVTTWPVQHCEEGLLIQITLCFQKLSTNSVSYHSQPFRYILQFKLICRDKMTNDKYQTLLCKALMSACKE